MLSEQGEDVSNEFMPETQNKWFKLVAFFTSVCAVFGKRYFDFEKSKAEKKKEEKVQIENSSM